MFFTGEDSMRLSVRLVFAVLMLVTAAWSQAPAQTPAQPSAQAPAQTVAPTPGQTAAQGPAQTAAQTPAQIPAKNPLDAFQQFSASVSGGPLKWDKMKIYRSGNKIRAEHDYEKEIRISDLTKDRTSFVRHWVNRPVKCGTSDKLDIAAYPFFNYTERDFSVERSPTVEKETLNGHSCKVEDYTFRPKDGRTQYVNMKLWEAEDLKGFPIQMEITPSATGKFTLRYTDVSVEPPDPKLFQLPALCRAGAHPKKKPPASTSKAPSQTSPKPPQ
jgi:hypothetical protein